MSPQQTHDFPAFPAKLLLFGEYTILMGSQALALPLSTDQYCGRLSFSTSDVSDPSLLDWAQFLEKEATGLTELQFDHRQLSNDIGEGLCFKANIPYGYGLGSSGVLCAAILTRYTDPKKLESLAKDPDRLKQIFIEMESFFHQKSSGLDPLVSFYNRAIFLPGRGELELLTSGFADRLEGFYLVDSYSSRQTAHWVQIFHDRLQDDAFRQKMTDMAGLQTRCITSFLDRDTHSLAADMQALSQAQIWTMKEWIPTEILDLWLRGLDSQQYFMKLCGAGGGGYFLAYVPEDRRTDAIPTDWISL